MEHLRWILLGVGAIGLAVMYFRWQKQSRSGGRSRTEPRISAQKKSRANDREPNFDDWKVDDDPIANDSVPAMSVESNVNSASPELVSVASDPELREPVIEDEPSIHVRHEPSTSRVVGQDAELVELGSSDEHDSVDVYDETSFTSEPQPQHIVVLHVKAKSEQGFSGLDLVRVFTSLEMEYGEMKIFHRYPGDDKANGPIFSVANMFEPGVFDKQEMATLVTSGITLFMQLPGPVDDVVAYDDMIACAQYLATDLNGEILDDGHQPFSVTKSEKHRQSVVNFSETRSAPNQ